MEKVAIYGFGSFFKQNLVFEDIDFLLIHQSTKKRSCNFAIRCKNILSSQISKAHFVLLSCSEEIQFDFIRKSDAMLLGNISEDSTEKDLNVMLVKVNSIIDLLRISDNKSTRNF